MGARNGPLMSMVKLLQEEVQKLKCKTATTKLIIFNSNTRGNPCCKTYFRFLPDSGKPFEQVQAGDSTSHVSGFSALIIVLSNYHTYPYQVYCFLFNFIDCTLESSGVLLALLVLSA